MFKVMLIVLLGVVGLFGMISVVDGSYKKVTYVPHWYQADKQPNYNVQFPEGAEIVKAQKQQTRHATNVDVVNPAPTHNEGIDNTLTKQQVIDSKKKTEETRALELMRMLGYV